MTNYTWKIVVIGDGSVGKTSLIHRYIDNKFQESYNETIGIDLFTHNFTIDGSEINLLIYDLGGQSYWKKLRSDFYNRAKGVMLVYDVSRTETFSNLSSWLTEAFESIGHSVPCVVVGNKCDLNNSIPKDLFESTMNNFKFNHCLASAKTGDSVLDSFKKLSLEILHNDSSG